MQGHCSRCGEFREDIQGCPICGEFVGFCCYSPRLECCESCRQDQKEEEEA